MKYNIDGVCAKEVTFEVHEGRVRNVQFLGGCSGNLNAISVLLEGMPVQEVVAKLKGNLCRNGTSCTDQFAKVLETLDKQ